MVNLGCVSRPQFVIIIIAQEIIIRLTIITKSTIRSGFYVCGWSKIGKILETVKMIKYCLKAQKMFHIIWK